MQVDAMRHAIEARDVETILGLYADDAEIRIVDRNNPPSRPLTLHGRDQFEPYLRDIYARDMTHAVEQMVAGQDRVSFNEACRYPDGARVLSANALELRDGRVTGHTLVQAWDE